MSSKAKAVAISTAKKAIYSFPVLGWLLKDAVKGGPTALLWFIFNIIAVWLIAIAYFGLPALIVPALVAVPVIFVVLILLTMGK